MKFTYFVHHHNDNPAFDYVGKTLANIAYDHLLEECIHHYLKPVLKVTYEGQYVEQFVMDLLSDRADAENVRRTSRPKIESDKDCIDEISFKDLWAQVETIKRKSA